MKITANETITTQNFTPIKIIDFYRKGKKFYTLKTYKTTDNLADLKRNFRANSKFFDNNKLAVVDNNGLYYNYEYLTKFKNIAENYTAYKKLLEYLKKENKNIIIETGKNYKKEYKKSFKIIKIA